jgi:hypothetical protein
MKLVGNITMTASNWLTAAARALIGSTLVVEPARHQLTEAKFP